MNASEKRIAELLLASHQGSELSDNDRQELNALLRESEANREFAVQFLLDSESLTALLAAEEISDISARRHRTLVTPRRFPAWLLGMAAALLFVGLFILTRSKPEVLAPDMPSEPVAQVARGSAVAVLNVVESTSAPSGELQPGPLQFDTGMVRIDFFSGVRMLLRGPADIEIRSASEVFINHGEASCFVSEIGRGFRLLTADGEVIDLGTAFGIRVRRDQASEVHVFEGEVSVRPTDATEFVDLKAEEAIQLGAAPQQLPYARDGFPSVAEIADRAQARYDAWLAHSESLRADTDVLLYCNFEGQQAGDGELRNQATSDSRSSHGAIIGARWSQGRWPMKSSLHFGSDSDRVLFKVPGGFRQLSMLVWARVDALPNEHQTLLLSQPPNRWRLYGNPSQEERLAAVARRAPEDAYAMRWTLRPNGTGSVMFLMDAPDGSVMGAGHGLPEFVTPNRQGQWICLAVVYDGEAGTLRSFVDGELHFEQAAKYRGPVHLDFMEMGNLSLENGQDYYRFCGAFDEVLVAKRAMTDTEIREIYEIGAP
jgi:ferric-dicitrate binding protein FerR (iron transport regulator)